MSRAKCIIQGCGSFGKEARELGISFHEIPSSGVREKWLQVINIPNVKPEAKVCSIHFQENDFKRCLKRRVLRPDAVPSLFLDLLPSLALHLPTSEDSSKKTHPISELVLNELKRSDTVMKCSVKGSNSGIPISPSLSKTISVSHESLQTKVSQDPIDSKVSPVNDNLSEESPIIKPPEHSITFVDDPEISEAVAMVTDHAYSSQNRGNSNKNKCSPQTPESVSSVTLRNSSETETLQKLKVYLPQVKENKSNPPGSSSHYLVKEQFDHSYSLSSPQNVHVKPDGCDPRLNNATNPFLPDGFQIPPNELKIWPGPEAFNQAMDAKENLKLCVENRILKRKILELNLQYKKSISSMKRKCDDLNAKLKSLAIHREKSKKSHKRSKPLQLEFDDMSNQFAKLRKDAKGKHNVKANFLLDQIKMYGRKTCFNDTTFQISKTWFEKGPEAYEYLRKENILSLPPESMFCGINAQVVLENLLKKCVNLTQKEKFVTLHIDVKQKHFFEAESKPTSQLPSQISSGDFVVESVPVLTEDCEVLDEDHYLLLASSETLKEVAERGDVQADVNLSRGGDQDGSHLVAFALEGLTFNFRIPCAFHSVDNINGHLLANLTKTVTRDMEEMGFTVVRLVSNFSDVTTSLFKCLGMDDLPQITHPCDPSRMLFLTHDCDGIVKYVCDSVVSFSLVDSKLNIRKNILADLQKLRTIEAINPASYFLSHYIMSKNCRSLNSRHQVEVFSGPVAAALVELKRRDSAIHLQNHEFLVMLEKWQSIENIFNVTQKLKNSERIVRVTAEDERLMWLQKDFGDYLQSVIHNTRGKAILPLHEDLLHAIILCRVSTLLCLQSLVKVLGSYPPLYNKTINRYNQKKYPMKRPCSGVPKGTGEPDFKKKTSSAKQVEKSSEISSEPLLCGNSPAAGGDSMPKMVDVQTKVKTCPTQPLSTVNINSVSHEKHVKNKFTIAVPKTNAFKEFLGKKFTVQTLPSNPHTKSIVNSVGSESNINLIHKQYSTNPTHIVQNCSSVP